MGRALADRGQLEQAEAWFAARDGDCDPAFDEASLVGRMRTRLLRGDRNGVASLLSIYRQRHPDGLRRDEADRFREALGATTGTFPPHGVNVRTPTTD